MRGGWDARDKAYQRPAGLPRSRPLRDRKAPHFYRHPAIPTKNAFNEYYLTVCHTYSGGHSTAELWRQRRRKRSFRKARDNGPDVPAGSREISDDCVDAAAAAAVARHGGRARPYVCIYIYSNKARGTFLRWRCALSRTTAVRPPIGGRRRRRAATTTRSRLGVTLRQRRRSIRGGQAPCDPRRSLFSATYRCRRPSLCSGGGEEHGFAVLRFRLTRFAMRERTEWGGAHGGVCPPPPVWKH